ncbi:fimbrial protein [Citrobacter koseri]|uniref:fimbrial protein n=1 Tax=Citrobacter koseri TaxID=545 RepID=UPI001F18228E|nr:hypothetical protein [Citrobacter koseri]
MMMVILMKKTLQKRLALLVTIILPLCMALYCVRSVANDVQLTFTYTVVQGTCDVNAPGSLQLGPPEGVSDAGSLSGQNWKFLHPTPLTVTLSNCAGSGSPGVTPYLTLQMVPVTGGSADRQNKLFADSGAQGTGLGVAVSNIIDSQPTDGSNNNLVSVSSPRIATGEAGATAINGPLTVWMALACGAVSDCTTAGQNAGTVTSTIKFAFEYQ